MEKIDGKKFAAWVDGEFNRLSLKKEKMFNETSVTSANLSQWRSGKYNPSKKKVEEIRSFIEKECKKNDPAENGEVSKNRQDLLDFVYHLSETDVEKALKLFPVMFPDK